MPARIGIYFCLLFSTYFGRGLNFEPQKFWRLYIVSYTIQIYLNLNMHVPCNVIPIQEVSKIAFKEDICGLTGFLPRRLGLKICCLIEYKSSFTRRQEIIRGEN